MDRTAAVIILLGIFLGSIHSFTIQTREVRTYTQPGTAGDKFLQRQVPKSGLVTEVSEPVWKSPPPTAPTMDDAQVFNYDIEDAYGGGRNKVDSDNQTVANLVSGDISRIEVDLDGATATIPDIEKRIFYEDFVVAIVVPSGDGNTGEIAYRLGGVVVEEYPSSVLFLVPENAESGLESLLDEGKISSYEIGGWGTGLGKA